MENSNKVQEVGKIKEIEKEEKVGKLVVRDIKLSEQESDSILPKLVSKGDLRKQYATGAPVLLQYMESDAVKNLYKGMLHKDAFQVNTDFNKSTYRMQSSVIRVNNIGETRLADLGYIFEGKFGRFNGLLNSFKIPNIKNTTGGPMSARMEPIYQDGQVFSGDFNRVLKTDPGHAYSYLLARDRGGNLDYVNFNFELYCHLLTQKALVDYRVGEHKIDDILVVEEGTPVFKGSIQIANEVYTLKRESNGRYVVHYEEKAEAQQSSGQKVTKFVKQVKKTLVSHEDKQPEPEDRVIRYRNSSGKYVEMKIPVGNSQARSKLVIMASKEEKKSIFKDDTSSDIDWEFTTADEASSDVLTEAEEAINIVQDVNVLLFSNSPGEVTNLNNELGLFVSSVEWVSIRDRYLEAHDVKEDDDSKRSLYDGALAAGVIPLDFTPANGTVDGTLRDNFTAYINKIYQGIDGVNWVWWKNSADPGDNEKVAEDLFIKANVADPTEDELLFVPIDTMKGEVDAGVFYGAHRVFVSEANSINSLMTDVCAFWAGTRPLYNLKSRVRADIEKEILPGKRKHIIVLSKMLWQTYKNVMSHFSLYGRVHNFTLLVEYLLSKGFRPKNFAFSNYQSDWDSLVKYASLSSVLVRKDLDYQVDGDDYDAAGHSFKRICNPDMLDDPLFIMYDCPWESKVATHLGIVVQKYEKRTYVMEPKDIERRFKQVGTYCGYLMDTLLQYTFGHLYNLQARFSDSNANTLMELFYDMYNIGLGHFRDVSGTSLQNSCLLNFDSLGSNAVGTPVYSYGYAKFKGNVMPGQLWTGVSALAYSTDSNRAGNVDSAWIMSTRANFVAYMRKGSMFQKDIVRFKRSGYSRQIKGYSSLKNDLGATSINMGQGTIGLEFFLGGQRQVLYLTRSAHSGTHTWLYGINYVVYDKWVSGWANLSGDFHYISTKFNQLDLAVETAEVYSQGVVLEDDNINFY